MYDFPDNVTSNTKLIADDASLFSVVHDVNNFKIELNDDLKTFNEYSIGKWVSILIRANKPRKLFSVVNQRDWPFLL